MEFETVYVEHFKVIYRFLLSLCRNAHLAEDLSQETFMRAMKHFKEYKGQCAPDTWLCSIAKNCYFDWCRKNRRLVFSPDAPETETDTSLEDALADKEQTFRIHAALHTMDEPYKEVFTLRVFGELSYQQIAALFGKNEAWGRVTYYRAKCMVQEALKEEKNGQAAENQ